ncbi:Integrase [Burkholderiales bacterium 8X]|nr:Integrase [Burkholderiales bacterium 8X]
MSLPPASQRKLGSAHFAFMRAIAQGLDERAAWDRYLRIEGEHSDRRAVRRTIAWIRDEFATAAIRQRKPGTARLIRLDPNRFPAASPVPSLAEFAAAESLEEFSEAEQLEAYQAAYPAEGGGRAGQGRARPAQRVRLVRKQLEALQWLQGLSAQDPRPGDPLTAWLHPALARRLESVGIGNLFELAERVNARGARWWVGIPGIGKGKAERILDWLQSQEGVLRLRVGMHARMPRASLTRAVLDQVVPAGTALLPLEKFVPPKALDGSVGGNRAPVGGCTLAARNDREAIDAWLRSKRRQPRAGSAASNPGSRQDPAIAAPAASARPAAATLARSAQVAQGEQSPQGARGAQGAQGARAVQGAQVEPRPDSSATQRSYRKEAERLMLWSVLIRGKAVSSLSPEDAAAYGAFLAEPPADWCGPRHHQRWSPEWRPFEGPLAPSARRQAQVILRGLFNDWIGVGYVRSNPFAAALSSTSPSEPQALPNERALTREHWDVLDGLLQETATTEARKRVHRAVRWISMTGLRLGEITKATCGDLSRPASTSSDPNGAAEPHRSGDAAGMADPGWQLAIRGRQGEKRSLAIPATLVEELSAELSRHGFEPEVDAAGNRDVALLARFEAHRPNSSMPPPAWSASGLYQAIKALTAQAADRLDGEAAEQIRKASTHWLRHGPGHRTDDRAGATTGLRPAVD